jgi:hypothetical protein
MTCLCACHLDTNMASGHFGSRSASTQTHSGLFGLLMALDLVPRLERVLANRQAALVPWARLELCDRETRIACKLLRAAYSVYIWELQAAANLLQTRACQQCGLPTGNWCDRCELNGRSPCSPLCTGCEGLELTCRSCE